MRKLKNFTTALVLPFLVAALALVQSCSKAFLDDTVIDGLPESIVTVKTASDGQTYFQLDSLTTFEPVDWENSYEREVRAFLNYSELPENSGRFSKSVRVDDIDSILTKNAVSTRNADYIAMSDDAIEIVDDWMTCCEDGYLTIHFAAMFSGKVVHTVALGVNPSNPKELTIKHSLNGDTSIVLSEGIVAFRLDQIFNGAVKDGEPLTLKWKSYSGTQSVQIKYSGRYQLVED